MLYKHACLQNESLPFSNTHHTAPERSRDRCHEVALEQTALERRPRANSVRRTALLSYPGDQSDISRLSVPRQVFRNFHGKALRSTETTTVFTLSFVPAGLVVPRGCPCFTRRVRDNALDSMRYALCTQVQHGFSPCVLLLQVCLAATTRVNDFTSLSKISDY